METTLYFFISYPRKNKEKFGDIHFIVPEDKINIPTCIYMDETNDNNLYYYKKVFMINKSIGKGRRNNEFYFEFDLDDDRYIISFDSKGASFIYDIKLEKTKRTTRLMIIVKQDVIEYYDKMHIFINALKENNEKNKIDLLYKDAIELFSIKKYFTFLIELFVEIYKKEDLCKILLDKFKEMNLNKKYTKHIMERKSLLEKHKSIFNTIISEADNYDYDTIGFYGIILCYLNYYDYDNFTRIINELYKSKSKELFEILLIYNSHFKYKPINQNFDFFNKLIEYTILNKDYKFFEEGLKYIGDIETFINIIEKNKDNLFNKYFKDNIKYLKCTIKLDDYLKFIKTENGPTKSGSISTKDKLDQEINNNPTTMVIQSGDRKENNIKKISKKELEIKKINFEKNIQNHFIIKFIKKIDLLISFSKIEKTFFIYFTNNFWKYILNNFNEPNEVSIYICYKLREVFMKYYDLVNEIFKDRYKKFPIKYAAINYYELDEFAILLDKNIKKYIINNKKLENIEKLTLIKKYHPYYKEERFKYLVDINIFDLFDFNNIDNEFIENFRNMRFENIFKENINEFINKIFSKIKKCLILII